MITVVILIPTYSIVSLGEVFSLLLIIFIVLVLYREFEFLRILIDGAHVQGQKRLKRPHSGGGGGHLG